MPRHGADPSGQRSWHENQGRGSTPVLGSHSLNRAREKCEGGWSSKHGGNPEGWKTEAGRPVDAMQGQKSWKHVQRLGWFHSSHVQGQE